MTRFRCGAWSSSWICLDRDAVVEGESFRLRYPLLGNLLGSFLPTPFGKLRQKWSQDRVVPNSLLPPPPCFLAAEFLFLPKKILLNLPLHFHAVEVFHLFQVSTTSLGECILGLRKPRSMFTPSYADIFSKWTMCLKFQLITMSTLATVAAAM